MLLSNNGPAIVDKDLQISRKDNLFAKVDAEWFFSPATVKPLDFANVMVNTLIELDCNLSLLEIVRDHLAKKLSEDVPPYTGIYKVV